MTREITHMKAFMAALESMGKDPLVDRQDPADAGLVDQYFNDSTGEGDAGRDSAGPGTRATAGSSSRPPPSRSFSTSRAPANVRAGLDGPAKFEGSQS